MEISKFSPNIVFLDRKSICKINQLKQNLGTRYSLRLITGSSVD
jgi:hypothetical protein